MLLLSFGLTPVAPIYIILDRAIHEHVQQGHAQLLFANSLLMKLAEKLADYATINKVFVQKPSHLNITMLLQLQLFA